MQKSMMSTKTLTYCALLSALSVVLARLVIPMPAADTRFSIEAVPIFLAGMLFGPIPGALVGFCADFVGCLFSPFGYNPIYCIPPLLYGLFGGIFAPFLRRKMSILRMGFSLLPPVVLGSVLIQSAVLSFMQFEGAFLEGYIYYLTTRGIQFAITLVLDTAVLYLLFKSRIFDKLGLWKQQ